MVQDFGQFIDKNLLTFSLIYSFLLGSISLFAQENSKYSDKEGNYLYFLSNKVYFRIPQSTGLGDSYMVGMGSYKIRKNKIQVTTEKYPQWDSVTESRYSVEPSQKLYIFMFSVVDRNNKPITGVNIFYHNQSGLVGKQTDELGNVDLNIAEMPIDSIIRAELLGYQPIRIYLNNLNSIHYKVILHEGSLHIVENQKIVLNLKQCQDTLLINYMSNSKTTRLIKL
jgi:hypothetical protein